MWTLTMLCKSAIALCAHNVHNVSKAMCFYDEIADIATVMCNIWGSCYCEGMNGILGHLCEHIGWTGSREPPEDGELNEMTLPCRHRIQNSSHGYLSVTEAPQNNESLRLSREKTFFTDQSREMVVVLYTVLG